MGLDRVVVHNFEGTTLGADFNFSGTVVDDESIGPLIGDNALYDGDDWGYVRWYSETDFAYHWQRWGVYDDHAAFGARSVLFPKTAPDGGRAENTDYSWRGEGNVCGLELTFKVLVDDDTDPLDDNILMVDMQTGGFAAPYRPLADVFFTFRPTGIWWAGASGLDDAGDPVGPGTTFFEGDGIDVLPVDYSRWLTMKLLPTGDWSLAYADGGTLMSGTLVEVFSGGASVDIGSGRSRGASKFWIDNVVFWLYSDIGSGNIFETRREFT